MLPSGITTGSCMVMPFMEIESLLEYVRKISKQIIATNQCDESVGSIGEKINMRQLLTCKLQPKLCIINK